MKALILANGEYGRISRLKPRLAGAELIICADGGANYAWHMGLKPDFIVGDMDSVRPRVREFYARRGIEMIAHPPRKDATDLQLALALARRQGATEVLVAGALGGRLDFALSNLLAGLPLVDEGIAVCYVAADLRVYLCGGKLTLTGSPGDIMSLLPLTPSVTGVCLTGFEYPLNQARLTAHDPYAVSNLLLASRGEITVAEGVAAVFHYDGIKPPSRDAPRQGGDEP